MTAVPSRIGKTGTYETLHTTSDGLLFSTTYHRFDTGPIFSTGPKYIGVTF